MRLHTIEDNLPVARDVADPFDETCDVAVVGLGTAGAIAAIAAGREGLSVIGIEPHSYMGGVGTGGGIHMYYHGTTGGIQDEVDAAVTETAKIYAQQGARGFHPDAKKYVLEKMALDAGVRPLYRTRITGVYRDGARVAGIRIAGPEGGKSIGTQFVIDASGDGEACAMAGCQFLFGREFDGQPQAYSMPRGFINTKGKVDGANFDAGYVDPTDAEDFSQAICRGQMLHLCDEFEAENRMLYAASHPGLREGRFIIGEQTLTYADLIGERKVDNIVMQTYAHHDNHAQDWAFEGIAAQDWVVVCNFWSRRTLAEVPYGVLVPKGMDGIFAAGRCVSMDHDSSQTFRMQRDMQKLGEIAGVAAAVAIKAGTSAWNAPYETLSAKLSSNGCLPKNRKAWAPWLTDVDAIREALSSDDPGVGTWSARLLGDSIADSLVEWSEQTEDENLRVNASFALGLLGRTEGLPALRELIERKDTKLPNSPNMHRFQQRNHAAMYLLGRLEDAGGVDLLLGALLESETDFNTISQSMVALLRIGRRHENFRERIAKVLVDRLGAEDFALWIGLKNSTAPTRSTRAAEMRSRALRKAIANEDLTQYARLVAAREIHAWGLPCDKLRDASPATFRDRRLRAQIG